MSRQVKKTAPIAIVAGALGYLSWPYLGDGGAAPPAKNPENASELTASILSPSAAPAPERDPFGAPAGQQSAFAQSNGEQPATGEARPAKTGSTTAPEPAAAKGTLGARPDAMDLQATHIRGEHRLALISGSVYAEGDEIKASGASDAPATLTRVFAHKVLLRRAGQTVELTYSSDTD